MLTARRRIHMESTYEVYFVKESDGKQTSTVVSVHRDPLTAIRDAANYFARRGRDVGAYRTGVVTNQKTGEKFSFEVESYTMGYNSVETMKFKSVEKVSA